MMTQHAAQSLFLPEQSSSLPISSPYMSIAPILTEEARALFPAITHFDHTARVQTVTPDQEPWVHELLEAVGEVFVADQRALRAKTEEPDQGFTSSDGQVGRKKHDKEEGRRYAVLMNTSFNTKGRPLVNRIDHALEMLVKFWKEGAVL